MFALKKAAKIAALGAAMSFGAANAASLLGQVPDPSLIISAGGYEWVYANPCAGVDPSCGVVQLSNGFHFASNSEWNASFANLNALVSAFTLPIGGARCASPYFSVVWDHCDVSDALQGYIWHSPLAANQSYSDASWAETFLVRGAAVPEPATLALLTLGLFGFAASRRSKKA